MARKTAMMQQRVESLKKRLRHPGHKLQEQTQHLDHLDIRLRRAMTAALRQQQYRVSSVQGKLARLHPARAIEQRHQQIQGYLKQLSRSMAQQLEAKQNAHRTGHAFARHGKPIKNTESRLLDHSHATGWRSEKRHRRKDWRPTKKPTG